MLSFGYFWLESLFCKCPLDTAQWFLGGVQHAYGLRFVELSWRDLQNTMQSCKTGACGEAHPVVPLAIPRVYLCYTPDSPGLRDPVQLPPPSGLPLRVPQANVIGKVASW
jgi:hypothetical protein